MRLTEADKYRSYGLGDVQQGKLSELGDILLSADFNVTRITDPLDIERFHFLDSLSLLSLPCFEDARRIVDIGSGAGMPALVLAVVLDAEVVALESQRKKCDFIERAAASLSLTNLTVCCGRAEDYGRGAGRETFQIAVSRALAALPTVAEYSIPLLCIGGCMVAMKGAVSNEELMRGEKALGILGGDRLQASKLQPFEDATNRWAYTSIKRRVTPGKYPRHVGVPSKRPLGAVDQSRDA